MEKAKLSPALFAGTHFDRKRFVADFSCFRQGPTSPAPDAVLPAPEKKRKRKSKSKAKKDKKKRGEAAASASGMAAIPIWLGICQNLGFKKLHLSKGRPFPFFFRIDLCSKERAKELYKELAFDDIRADVIHADLTEEQFQDAVDNLRAGKTWILNWS